MNDTAWYWHVGLWSTHRAPGASVYTASYPSTHPSRHPFYKQFYLFPQQTVPFVGGGSAHGCHYPVFEPLHPVPAFIFTAIKGISSQTHCLDPATGGGMPALGISGLGHQDWVSLEPSCQRISFHSSTGTQTQFSIFLCCHGGCALSFLCTFMPGKMLLNSWQQSCRSPAPPATLPSLVTPLISSNSCIFSLSFSLPLSPSLPLLFFSHVLISLSTFFLGKEEGLC